MSPPSNSEPDRDAQLAAVAAKHDGAFCSEDLRAVGFTRTMVSRRVRSGQWERVFDGVYRFPGAAQNREQQLRLAQLWMGKGAAFSHWTAAEILRLDGVKKRQWVDVCTGASASTAPKGPFEVRVHRQAGFKKVRDFAWLFGRPVTTAVTTLIALAPELKDAELERAVLDGVRRELIDPDDYRKRVGKLAKGVAGVAKLRRYLGIAPKAQHLGSPLEVQVLRFILKHGLPEPIASYDLLYKDRWLGNFDFGWPEQRMLIECDGVKEHATEAARAHDLEKSNRAQAIGWRVFRVTSALLKEKPDELLNWLREGLATPVGSKGPSPYFLDVRGAPEVPDDWDAPPPEPSRRNK